MNEHEANDDEVRFFEEACIRMSGALALRLDADERETLRQIVLDAIAVGEARKR